MKVATQNLVYVPLTVGRKMYYTELFQIFWS